MVRLFMFGRSFNDRVTAARRADGGKTAAEIGFAPALHADAKAAVSGGESGGDCGGLLNGAMRAEDPPLIERPPYAAGRGAHVMRSWMVERTIPPAWLL